MKWRIKYRGSAKGRGCDLKDLGRILNLISLGFVDPPSKKDKKKK